MTTKLVTTGAQKQLKQRLSQVRKSDYHRLLRRFKQIDDSEPEKLALLAEDIARSIDEKSQRLQSVPELNVDQSLPIFQRFDEIKQYLQKHQVLVVCGETGSGKTTQLPQYCLTSGLGIEGIIGHTQPRRLAARSVAKRIADEMHTELGDKVAYKIRHHDLTAKDTLIKIMTDGVLLAEMQHDRFLNQYDCLIIDEAHERSLNIDFILGFLKQLLVKRHDLKVIITSATIDVERFSQHFDQAPIIEVSGRTYPVDVIYQPNEDEDAEREDTILDAINELSTYDRGDILVFLEGEGEIHQIDTFLQKRHLPDTDVLPLYSRLSSARQNKIFSPHQRRHIVLATNVAETSLTIPGIRYVIDAGFARISRYSYRSKVQRLPIEKISQAAANQRKGRCGRTSDGICIRLYSEEDFLSRPEYTQPEILRTNLASVVLQMKSLKLGDIQDFPFLEPPDTKLVNDGIRLLKEINALDEKEKLTGIGKRMARLPIEPRYARILLAANEFYCLHEILIIISALSIQDARERPMDTPAKADKAHQAFADEKSDFLWFINVWQFYQTKAKQLSQKKLRKLCKQNFLSYLRMQEWQNIYRQLKHICIEMKLSLNSEAANYQNIHCAMLTGMPSHVAFLSDQHEYTGARNIKFNIFPASCLFQSKPKWVVAAELVETSRLYARQVATVDPLWVISTAKHLLKFNYSDAKWEQKSARVIAMETTSLFGMTLRANRKVNYGNIDPAQSRSIFIRYALIDGEFDSRAHFVNENNRLINAVREMEIKTRRPDILDEDSVYAFYLKVIPEQVYDGQSFSLWLKQASQEILQQCYLTENDLLSEASSVEQSDYPDEIYCNKIRFPVEYKFLPGEKHDGLNIDVPLELLNQLENEQFDYLVPGLLAEKITCLLKSLPKPIRKQLVPIPDTADECLNNLNNYDVPLKSNLANYLFRTRGIDIKPQDWSTTSLPEHLTISFHVYDHEQEYITSGDNLDTLRERLAAQTEKAIDRLVDDSTEQKEITEWDFGDIPVTESVISGNNSITLYPALIEEQGKIYRHAFDSLETAESYFKHGLRALFKKKLEKELRYLRKNISGWDQLCIMYSAIGTKDDLLDSFVNQVIDKTFLYQATPLRKQEQFLSSLSQDSSFLLTNAESLSKLLRGILDLNRQINVRLADYSQVHFRLTIDDITDQLEYLIFNGFVEDTQYEDLSHYPRYLAAILKRLDKLEFNIDKDKKNIVLISEHWQRIRQLVDNAYETGQFLLPVMEYRWMMEELRISLFAQELKTRMPISLKRMDKKWDIIKHYKR